LCLGGSLGVQEEPLNEPFDYHVIYDLIPPPGRGPAAFRAEQGLILTPLSEFLPHDKTQANYLFFEL
jgi:hypothetical protein